MSFTTNITRSSSFPLQGNALLVCAFVATVAMLISAIAYTLKPETFKQDKFSFDRSAEHVPLRDTAFPSTQDIERYCNGDGFLVTLTVRDDPRANYATSKKQVELQPATGWFDYPERRKLVQAKLNELRLALDEFSAVIPIPQSVEVCIDVTDGVTASLKNLVLSSLDEFRTPLVHANGPVTLQLCRLSNTDHRDYRTWTIPADQTAEQVDRVLVPAVSDWLLHNDGPRPGSSIALGLFNVLKIQRDLRRRSVFIFSDGLETKVSSIFYRAATVNPDALAKSNWEKIDEQLSAWESFPDLRFATVTWHFVRHDFKFYRVVHRYWEHVLKDRTRARQVEIIF
jgi:hypothetical protein